jgi:lipopolysaccharide/colanic/teichoic acid biosynthesis glycosyltransferase
MRADVQICESSKFALENPDNEFLVSQQLPWYYPYKVGVEWLIALVLLVLTAPLLIVAVVLVKLSSTGPILYSQVRLGRKGRPYRIFKVRTMIHNCEKISGAIWSTPKDPRITPIGRFLRASHLDELPQLWNVLSGKMNLIGPRPERPEFVPTLEKALPHYRDRLLVRPGVTGLAQVQLPADTDIDSVRRKLAYDLYYVRHLNPWLDLRILLCTAFHVIGIPFHTLRAMFLMPHSRQVFHTYRNFKPVPETLPQLQAN